MRVYTVEENDYNDTVDFIENVVKCGKKILKKMEYGDFNSRDKMNWRDDDDEDYDWKIKKGRRY